jgi:hypothetical protein
VTTEQDATFEAWWRTTNISASTGALTRTLREIALKGWNARGEADARVCELLRDKWVDGSDYSGRPMNVKIKVTPTDCATAIRGMK